MGTLEFISSLISSLAWPLSILGIIYILKDTLKNKINSTIKIRYDKFEADFDQAEKQFDSLAAYDTAVPVALPEPERIFYSSIEEQIVNIAPHSPEAAILIAWSRIEVAINSTIARFQAIPTDISSVSKKIEILEQNTDIDKDFFKILTEVYSARNKAAHGKYREITVDGAIKYGKLAERVIKIIQNLRRHESE